MENHKFFYLDPDRAGIFDKPDLFGADADVNRMTMLHDEYEIEFLLPQT